jgi:hypothetical protein
MQLACKPDLFLPRKIIGPLDPLSVFCFTKKKASREREKKTNNALGRLQIAFHGLTCDLTRNSYLQTKRKDEFSGKQVMLHFKKKKILCPHMARNNTVHTKMFYS